MTANAKISRSSRLASTLRSAGASRLLLKLLAGAAMLVLVSPTAQAASGTWTNSIADGNWSGAINWSGGTIADGADSTATFSSTATRKITLDTARTIGNLTFNTSSYNLIGGNLLTLQTSSGNPNILVNAGTTIIGAPLSASQLVTISSGNNYALTNQANSFAGGLTLQASQCSFFTTNTTSVPSLGGSAVITLGSSVGSGQMGFNVTATNVAGSVINADGSPSIIIPNNINVQTIRWIFDQNALAFNVQPVNISGNVYLNSGSTGVRDIYTFQPLTISGMVSGGGTYGLNLANGTLTLNNSGNSYSGNANFTGGSTLGVNSDGALGFSANTIQFKAASATLRINAPFTTARSFNLANTGTINVQTNLFEIDGGVGTSVYGTGGLTVSGTSPGQLILTGPNTFTGTLTVNSGANLSLFGGGSMSTVTLAAIPTNAVLAISDSFSVPNILSYTVNNGGLLILSNAPSLNSAASFTLTGSNAKLDDSSLSSPLALGGTLSGSGLVTGSVNAQNGSIIIPGANGTAGTLSVSNALTLNGQTIQIDLSTNVVEGGGTNDEILVGGNLVLNGGEKILLNYLNGSLAAGTYKIIKYGGTLTGTFSLLTSYPNVTIDNGVGTLGYITLVVSAPSVVNNLFWKGDGSGNLWDLGTTANWVTNFANAALVYTDPSKVTFNDFGSNNVPVTLNSVVYPNVVTFNVTNKAYTLTGSGKISGPTGVTISGGNYVTNLLGNDYTGGTVLNNASKLVLGNGGSSGAAGSGTITMGNTTSQVIVNENTSVNLPTVTGSGGSPQVIQNGSGTTALTGSSDNSYLQAVVNNGTLRLAKVNSASAHALGGATTVNTGGTLQLGGTGGDQIYSGVTVTLAGGTFDTAGLSEGFTTLSGYGSVINGGTLTLTSMLGLSPSGTMAVTNTPIIVSGGNWLQNPGSVIFEGSTVTLSAANTWTGVGTAGNQNILIDGTLTGNGEAIWGEQSDTSVTTFGPNANATFFYLSLNTVKASTFWFNGGSVTLARFNDRISSGTATDSLYFNGTLFAARRSDASFIPSTHASLLKFYVSANGFNLNDNGYNLTVGAVLAHDPALGVNADGGLTKSGVGNVSLAATNTFNGPVNVNGGSLTWNNIGFYGNVVLADTTTSSYNIATVGKSQTNNSLTMGSSGSGTMNLNFNLGTLGIPTVPVLNVLNAVTNSGNVVVTIAAPVLAPGTVPLIKYGSMNAANFASTWSISAFPYVGLTLTNDTVNNLISVIVVPGVTPKWKGDVSSAWDTSTLNWRSNGVATTYVETTPPGQPVTFDDTAVNFTVDISTATVNPLFINMTNGNNYTVTGSLGIGGTGALIKQGAGSLVLSNTPGANTYSGITTVSGGAIVAGAANLLSPNSAMTLNNSILNIGNNNQSIGGIVFNNTPITFGTATLTGGSLTFNNGASNFTLPVLAVGLELTQNGTGIIDITNANSYSGRTFVNAGTLRISNVSALGSGGFNDGTRTDVANGGALVFDGASGTTSEYIHFNGAGPTGAGAWVVTNGNVTANSPISLDTATTINVGTGSTLTNNNVFFTGGTIVKIGGGLLYVAGINGGCAISANGGTTLIAGNGGNAAGGVTVNSGATFGGTGTVGQSLVVNAGGTLTPGSFGIGTLTVNDSFTNAGNITMEISYNGVLTNADLISVATNLVYGGTLTVANVGPNPLAAGQTFKLFNSPSYGNGSFSSVALPPLVAGLGWTNGLAVNGTIAVVATVSTTPLTIGTLVNGHQLILNWPADHTGWRLQSQTNALSVGLNTNWVDVAGATLVNSVTNTIDPANGTVFYRMVYP